MLRIEQELGHDSPIASIGKLYAIIQHANVKGHQHAIEWVVNILHDHAMHYQTTAVEILGLKGEKSATKEIALCVDAWLLKRDVKELFPSMHAQLKISPAVQVWMNQQFTTLEGMRDVMGSVGEEASKKNVAIQKWELMWCDLILEIILGKTYNGILRAAAKAGKQREEVWSYGEVGEAVASIASFAEVPSTKSEPEVDLFWFQWVAIW